MNPRLEKILKLPIYQRIIILLVLVLVQVGGFFYFLYLPASSEYDQLREENESLERKLVEDRRIARNLPKFKAEYEKLNKQLQDALKELPNKKEIPSLLTSISALAKENGLEVLRFKPGGENPQGFYAEVPVSLNLSGSYHQAGEFFDDIGNLPRIVNIENLTISRPKVESGRVILSIQCLATTYRFLEGK